MLSTVSEQVNPIGTPSRRCLLLVASDRSSDYRNEARAALSTGTCTCDIAYSFSPTASRASSRVGKNSIRTTLASWIVQTWV